MRKVSDYLREERERKGLTLDDVEKATKIKKNYLTIIEEGKFRSLPSESYALGFIKTYASFLDLPTQKIAAFFRREYEEESQEIIPEFRKKQHRFNKNFFSPQVFFVALVTFFVGGYIFFQYSSLLFGPKLDVTSPKNGDVISENVIEVKGKTDEYATVVIDNEEAYVNLDGSFKKSIYAFSGDKKITIVAKNRFGKETKEVVTVEVE